MITAKFIGVHFVNNGRSIAGEDDNTSYVMFITRSFDLLFEEAFSLNGDYSRYDLTTISA